MNPIDVDLVTGITMNKRLKQGKEVVFSLGIVLNGTIIRMPKSDHHQLQQSFRLIAPESARR